MASLDGMAEKILDYEAFLQRKRQYGSPSGFEPIWIPSFLFDFQQHLVCWAIQMGRSAIWADCGLGKTPMQLVWAENVVRHTNRPVLILAPLAVSVQTLQEGRKFDIDCVRSIDGRFASGARIVVTNYERLGRFSPGDFTGCVCDESSILKDFDGVRKSEITEFMRTLPFRLLCTATAAPNDYPEVGTSSEALGEMGFQDMVTRFFHKETQKDYLGWGRMKYRMRGHAEQDFWRWVCSWARACRKPSDLGFDDGPFILPELIIREHEVKANQRTPGMLFDLPAVTLQEQREEQRRTIRERCEKAAELVDHDSPAICWCHLIDESKLLKRIIPGSLELSGADSLEAKEEKLIAFTSGQARVLVTKPKLAGFGLNFQHCAHQTYFIGHSFEQWYQGVRRSWRFGQTRPVHIDLITTEGSVRILNNLKKKAERAEQMFSKLVRLMHESLSLQLASYGTQTEVLPAWL